MSQPLLLQVTFELQQFPACSRRNNRSPQLTCISSQSVKQSSSSSPSTRSFGLSSPKSLTTSARSRTKQSSVADMKLDNNSDHNGEADIDDSPLLDTIHINQTAKLVKGNGNKDANTTTPSPSSSSSSCPSSSSTFLIFKSGDDLRRDMACLQVCLALPHRLWSLISHVNVSVLLVVVVVVVLVGVV
jgi:hypothetical protein